jgi:hypothetical protein
VLTTERMRQIENEAMAHAETLSDDALRQEAESESVKHHETRIGDERVKLAIMDNVLTREMIRRGLGNV